MNIQQPIDMLNFEEFVLSLQHKIEELEETMRKTEKELRCREVCMKFFGGILSTHKRKDIPAHDSDESLYFFKNKDGESVLIEELKPLPDLMPEMERIPLSQALTKKMEGGDIGCVIQKVTFSYPTGSHELVLICFEQSSFEKL